MNSKKLSIKKICPLITTDTLEPDMKKVISVKVEKDELATEITKNSFFNSSFLVPVNAKEPSKEKVVLEMIIGTLEPDTKNTISAGVEKDKFIIEMAKNSSSNSFLMSSFSNSFNKSESGSKQDT